MKTLSRDEMKGIIGGFISAGTCYCWYGDCHVALHQYSGWWDMSVYCSGNSHANSYSGRGQYAGSACGGAC